MFSQRLAPEACKSMHAQWTDPAEGMLSSLVRAVHGGGSPHALAWSGF